MNEKNQVKKKKKKRGAWRGGVFSKDCLEAVVEDERKTGEGLLCLTKIALKELNRKKEAKIR